MKANRWSPVTRAYAWLMALALMTPTLMGSRANAQANQVLRVIVADFTNVSRNGGENLGITATAAVYNELANTGSSRFYVFTNPEVMQEAKRLGMKVPSNPGQPAKFGRSDLLRLAKELQADAIVEGKVVASEFKKGRPVELALQVTVLDPASLEFINGGAVQLTAKPSLGQNASFEELTGKALNDAALDVVRQMSQRQNITGTVLQRVGDNIILNRGLRDGIKPDMELVVTRDLGNGVKVTQGKIRIVTAYATDSEAKVASEVGGIRPEDVGRMLYVPPFEISDKGKLTMLTEHNRPVNFSKIGTMLSALGLGVLIAGASHGPNSSITNLSAEPTSQGDLPQVRITWNDNLWGNGGVLQYKIFRDPDFPYSPNLGSVGGNGGGGAGGGTGGGGAGGGTGGGNNAVLPPTPVGTTTFHVFLDRPSPNFAYSIGSQYFAGIPSSGSLTGITTGGGAGGGGGTGGGGAGGGTGGGTGGGGSGCTIVAIANGASFDTGFSTGVSYRYLVTSVILRQVTQSTASGVGGGGGGLGGGGGTGGGGGGFGGGGGGTGGGGVGGGGTGGGGQGGGQGGGTSSTQCIETDPVQSGLATPILPTRLTSPVDLSVADDTAFNPTWETSAGADVFQVEVSTDRLFSNPNTIVRRLVLSSFPTLSGQQQSLPDAIDLSKEPAMLADPLYVAFNNSGINPPAIYWRVGARHDEDVPGPVDWITKNATAPGKAWRLVYGRASRFTPAIRPPNPPGKAVRMLNAALARNRSNGLPLPLPGDAAGRAGATQSRVPTIQDILGGGRRRRL